MAESLRPVLPESLDGRLERAAFVSLAAAVSLSCISIAASQIMLAAAVAAALWAGSCGRGRMIWLPVFTPLLLFFGWTLVAALASSDVMLGLGIVKKFFLFLLVPLVAQLMPGKDRIKCAFHGIFAAGALASLAGIVQFAVNPHRDLLHRISGFMGHWMTYSGLLMLVVVALAAYGLSYGWRKPPWVAAGIAFFGIAIFLSQTRSAMLGAVAGTAAVALLRRPRILLPLAAGLALAYLLSPAAYRERIKSGWDASDPNTRNRIELLGTSLRLIRDNPVLGVGPKNVSTEALRYRGSREFPNWLYQHMHNNFLQIAAERGLVGLGLWLWLMGRFAYDAWRLFRSAAGRHAPGVARPVDREALLASTAALGCWVALLISGLFEYNFGDSEVLILFLFVVSTPYAALAAAGSAAPAKGTQSYGRGPV